MNAIYCVNHPGELADEAGADFGMPLCPACAASYGLPSSVQSLPPRERPADMGATLAELSTWIDTAPANLRRSPEAATWGRLAKVSEEAGEVIAAYIGATGQNPRKGITHGMAAVRGELLDVAVSALTAVEHLTGNRGASIEHLETHLVALRQRMDAAPAAAGDAR